MSAFAVAGAAQRMNLAVPNSHALVEGDANNGLPFSYGGMSLRYQQVYDASQFAVLRPNGGTISYLGFRCHEPHNEVRIRYQLVVKLSTTARAVNDLSTNLASHFGTDAKTVYNSTVFLIDPPHSAGQPWPFEIIVPFTSGFFYNPTNGNLLVEMYVWQYYTWYAGALLDTVTAGNDSVSRVYRDAQGYYGSTPDSLGAVTEFGVTPVVPLQPRITMAKLLGNDFIVEGIGGAPGLVYSVLRAADLAPSSTNWFCIGTNAFDRIGNFSFTNTLEQTGPQQFYRIEIQ